MKNKQHRWSGIISQAMIMLAGIAVLAMPSHAAQGTAQGLELCVSVVIPSLFMLMFVSVLVVESGTAERIGALLAPITRKLFGLPGAAGAALLLSVTGGYPAGAKAVRGLYDRGVISSHDAQRMSGFCFSAGPAFLIGTVGVMILSDTASGVLLLCVQILTVVLMGLIDRAVSPHLRSYASVSRDCLNPEVNKHSDKRISTISQHRDNKKKIDISSAIVSSARQACAAMLSVCLFVVMFSAIRQLLSGSGFTDLLCRLMCGIGISGRIARAVVPILLEVTGGCEAAAPCGLWAVAFAAGFGGISVHMQVFAILGDDCVRKSRFFLMRLVQGTLSAVLTALAMSLFPNRAFAASIQPSTAHAALSGSVTGSATLLLMCMMCLLCLPNISADAKKSKCRTSSDKS